MEMAPPTSVSKKGIPPEALQPAFLRHHFPSEQCTQNEVVVYLF